MSLGETAISILEKISSSIKIALTASISSFILLISSVSIISLAKIEEISQIKTSSTSQIISQFIAIISSDSNSEFTKALPVLFTIFVVSTTLAIIEITSKSNI
ncbi:MAG: hypothetical protein AAF298_09135, partial [Cyanobacteria bacterium P01_A01_bin.40]